jgi:nucleoside-diphosphate-sugar epimerase
VKIEIDKSNDSSAYSTLENLAGEKILITGASGFLGSHLRRRLRDGKARIDAVSRHAHESDEPGVRWWQAEMTDFESTRKLLQQAKPDVIFHLSGLATARPERELVLPTLHSLFVSTVNLLSAAAEIDCRRIILAASLTEPYAAGAEVTPGSPYAAAKWASSAYARMFHKLYEVPVVMVRPFMTYGPGQDEHKLIPHIILSLLNGTSPKLSSGRQAIDWIYVDDVIDGFLAATHARDVEGHTIDLGSGELTSIREVVTSLMELIGAGTEPLFGALPDRPDEPLRIANVEDARQRLNWRPRMPLKQGLARTVQWFHEQHRYRSSIAS